jgi:hypothetical protein
MALVSISPGASKNPSSGHWFWFYRHLYDFQARRGRPGSVTLGPVAAECEHVIGVYRLPFSMRRLLRQFGSLFSDYVRLRAAIRCFPSTEGIIFQFYDGWVNELVFAALLAKRFPRSKFIYNLHWASEWSEIFAEGKHPNSYFGAAVLAVIRDMPENVAVTAETKRLASAVSGRLGRLIPAYPVFAAFEVGALRDWAHRDYDVVFFPQRSDEVVWSLAACRRLELFGFRAAISCREEAWLRGMSDLSDGEKFLPRQDDSSGGPDLFFGPLSTEDFRALLSGSRVVVLPYRDPYFVWGSSGKFNEAIACGAFPLAPEDTAIITQSPGDPDSHGYPAEDLDSFVEVVRHRLREGFDERLEPTTVDDLIALGDTKSELQGPRRSTFWILRLLFMLICAIRFAARRA